jgi:hypothetical protein
VQAKANKALKNSQSILSIFLIIIAIQNDQL